MKALIVTLWWLLASALVGFVIGLVIVAKLETPTYYIGLAAEASALAPQPLDVGDAGAPVIDARHHEEQVG